MGWGDEIMAAGIAKRVGGKVVICDRGHNARWHPIWQGLDYIVAENDEMKPGEKWMGIVNAPGSRQYYHGMIDNRILWKKWAIAPGEIKLSEEEKSWAVDQFAMKDQHPRFLVINPSWKAAGGGGQNKDWGLQRWWEVAQQLKDVLLVQLIDHKSGPFTLIEGCVPIHTLTFREACAILDRSVGYVGHEGGLHHAAAALAKKAVVVFGGYISPDVTGYPEHRNLYTPDERFPLGCGSVTPCAHCKAAMEAITFEHVVNTVKEIL